MTIAGGALPGLVPGAIGAAVVTAGEKVEQRLTRRPSSTHQGGRWPSCST